MADHNSDQGVMAHIENLNNREQELYHKADLSEADIEELHKVKSQLDQYWDLLHQRQGMRDRGANPDRAEIRSQDTIANYKS